MNKHYDMIIVGAGPAGLTMAHCCSSVCKNILVIDKEDVIGGCHRVKRVQNGMFTEHSPRMYFTNYVNFFYLMSEVGLQKVDLFTRFYIDYVNTISAFSAKSLFILTEAYIHYLFDTSYGMHVSFKDYCQDKKLSQKDIDILDRFCRFTDGATIEKYSLNKMLEIIDSMNAQMLQPKGPLDKILFSKWQTFLEQRHVDFALGKNVTHVGYDVAHNQIKNIVLNDGQEISCDKLVLAIPPAAISKFLKQHKHIQNCFGNFHTFDKWAEKTEYIEYISMTFHFQKDVAFPSINIFNFDTDWGVSVINLSEYMKDIEDGDNTVLSIALTICDRPSKVTGKTANQSTKNEIIKETFRQIKVSLYPSMPDNYICIINPKMHYDLIEHKWNSDDEAYFSTVNTEYIPSASKMIKNIYNVGTHNGHSHLGYTTMESAVSNAMYLSCHMYPSLQDKYEPMKTMRIKDIIVIIVMLILLILILYIIYRSV
jgi:hypothetical protein